MVCSLEDKIKEQMKKAKENGKSVQISVQVNSVWLERLDSVTDEFKNLPNANLPTSRNQIIVEAINEYVKAAENVFKEMKEESEVLEAYKSL